MAELAIAAAASAIGGSMATGVVAMGMTGAQLGWMAGSIAASLLFQPKAPDGPRLEDKAVQVSTYGQPIPRLYGTHRLAGNVLWSTELIETATEEGGKGGPSYTTYSYRASFAVGVCRGPVAGIRRIWADGNIIFDQSQDNTGPQVGYEAENLAIYLGTETQLPDPTLQALQGDVPAYRGQVYVVFTDLQLAKFGNRLPSLTFEVVQSGVAAPRASELIIPAPAGVTLSSHRNYTLDTDTGYVWGAYGSLLVVYDPATASIVRTIPTSLTEPRLEFCAPTRQVWVCETGPFGNQLAVFSADTFTQVYAVNVGSKTLTCFCPLTGEMGLGSTFFLDTSTDWISVGSFAASSLNVGYSFLWNGVFIPEYNRVFLTGGPGYVVVQITLFSKHVVASGVIPGATQISMADVAVAYDPRRERVYRLVGDGRQIFIYDPATNSTSTVSVPGSGDFRAAHYHALSDTLMVSIVTSDVVHQLDLDSFTVRRIISYGAAAVSSMVDAPFLPDRLYANSSDGLVVLYLGDVLQSNPVPLSTVVAAESAMVGLQAPDLDTTALASTGVAGLAVTSAGAVRSVLEQLMMAYAFDAVESGGVVKFVRRGGVVVATLPDTHLAAHQPGAEVPTPLPITRAEEVELPQRITVRYSNPAADYQSGAQSAQRLTGRAMAQQGVDLPLVLTDAQAAQVAEAALYSAWAARSAASFTTTLRHAALEPTDVVSVGGNTLRITRRTENAGLITFEAAFENGAVYTQTAQGAAAGAPSQTIPMRSNTALEFLDVPPLRDVDDDAGFYLAASGYTSGWDGALVYKSADAGASYNEFMLLPSAATVGAAIDALGDAPQNTFDEVSAVAVVLRSGQLASLSELAVLNGGNAALLGGEIIQFKTATLNGDGSYTLRGLLRGRKGTPTGGHTAGERFVLLNAATLRRTPAVASEVGLERLYKGVSIGATLSSATARPFTNTAQAIRPLAPVHLGGGRSSGGNVLITWVRRARIGGAWRDNADAPLAEVSESYEVDVFSSNTFTTVLRTLASATSSVTYTSTQQTTDFGSVQAVVYVRVYQISAAAGRGRALQGSI